MKLAPSVIGTRVRAPARMLLLVVGTVLVAACAAERGGAKPAPGARPSVVTVPQLATMVQNGEAISVIVSEIQGSGTVYRLTPEQRARLRADGMPASILGLMENTYLHAIRQQPSLATSDERWIKIGEYWYGGLPAGWPREWVAR
jgi:hypothetical protein